MSSGCVPKFGHSQGVQVRAFDSHSKVALDIRPMRTCWQQFLGLRVDRKNRSLCETLTLHRVVTAKPSGIRPGTEPSSGYPYVKEAIYIYIYIFIYCRSAPSSENKSMDVTKPYKFKRFGAMDVTKPYNFKRFGAMDVT